MFKLKYCVIFFLTFFLFGAFCEEIFNDGSTTRGQYPFYVYLEVHMPTRRGISIKSCGGTLLSHDWILTSARCIKDAKRVQAHVGLYKVFNIHEEGRQIRTITSENFHIFPNYSKEQSYGDLALLKFPCTVNFTEYVQPMKISSDDIASNLTVIAIGTGSKSSRREVDVLKTTVLETIAHKKCIEYFPALLLNYQVICAKKKIQQEYCLGHTDNGGPILRTDDNILVGIINYSVHYKCEHRDPDTFTIITPHFHAWISDKTGLQ